MAHCPCCSDTLLRHIRHNQLTYFCRHCWQDMPLFDQTEQDFLLSSRQSAHLSASRSGGLVHRVRYSAAVDSSRLAMASPSVPSTRSIQKGMVGVSAQT